MKLLLVSLFLFSCGANAEVAINCKITSQFDLTARPTSAILLNSKDERRCLVFQNQGASTVYIKFGSAHSGTENYALATATSWEPRVVPENSVYFRSASGSVVLTVLEGQ